MRTLFGIAVLATLGVTTHYAVSRAVTPAEPVIAAVAPPSPPSNEAQFRDAYRTIRPRTPKLLFAQRPKSSYLRSAGGINEIRVRAADTLVSFQCRGHIYKRDHGGRYDWNVWVVTDDLDREPVLEVDLDTPSVEVEAGVDAQLVALDIFDARLLPGVGDYILMAAIVDADGTERVSAGRRFTIR